MDVKDNGIERRFTAREVRAEGEGRQIVGYPAMFNSLSEDLGGFVERIRPGAFGRSLESADVRGLFNHDVNYVIGRVKAGTLRLEEDEVGLRMAADAPDTQWARDLITSIRRGDVDQMSFGFRVIRDEWTQADDLLIRTLVEVELLDVSVVTFPAYPQTSAAVRARVSAADCRNGHGSEDGDGDGDAGGQEPAGGAGGPAMDVAEAGRARARQALRKRRLTVLLEQGRPVDGSAAE